MRLRRITKQISPLPLRARSDSLSSRSGEICCFGFPKGTTSAGIPTHRKETAEETGQKSLAIPRRRIRLRKLTAARLRIRSELHQLDPAGIRIPQVVLVLPIQSGLGLHLRALRVTPS